MMSKNQNTITNEWGAIMPPDWYGEKSTNLSWEFPSFLKQNTYCQKSIFPTLGDPMKGWMTKKEKKTHG